MPFRSDTFARVIDQDAAHHDHRQRDKLRAVLPVDALLIDQPQERFVDERRRLPRVIAALSLHVACSNATQLSVNERPHRLARLLVSAGRVDQQLSGRIRPAIVSHEIALSRRLRRGGFYHLIPAGGPEGPRYIFVRALPRGGPRERISLSLVIDALPQPPVDAIALNDALDRLTALDDRKGRIVELKFFGGLTTAEVAKLLNLSSATIEREWSFARAWLYDTLSPDPQWRP